MKLDELSGLIKQGLEFEKQLRELSGVDRSTAAWDSFIGAVRDWLRKCIEHGRYVPEGSADRRALQGQLDRWTTRLLQLGHPLPKFDLLDEFDPRAGRPLPDDLFPYFGLVAAQEAQRQFGDAEKTPRFYGREEQVREYADHLKKHPALLIQSESGGGKSSVVMAGVVPELRSRHPDWLFTPRATPGAHPTKALGDALAATPGLGAVAATDAATVVAALGNGKLVVFVDQLEELLTVCTDEADQEAFSGLLRTLAESDRVRILATLRSDHYDRLAGSQACRKLFLILTADNSVKTLAPMSFDQIRSVILRPAQAVGLRFVPASLVDLLANETANLPGGLPRLQFALKRLWDLRLRSADGQPLDLIDSDSFRKLPSVREALGTVAQRVFTGLSPAAQQACERLMLELTVLDEQSEVPLRRRRVESEVLGVLAGANLAPMAQVVDVISRFEREGLLVRTGEGEARQIEVAHESLFRYWPQFQEWLHKDTTRKRLKDVRLIARDAIQWDRSGRSPDYLKLRGEPLASAIGYRDENWLDPLSRRYCRACDEAEAWRKQLRWIVGGLLGTLLIGLVGGGLYIWSTERDNEARRVSATTTFASLVGQLDPLEAVDLAYSLEKRSPGRYVAPLAQALDLLAGSEVVGERDLGADFSPSGHALVQLVRADPVSNRLDVVVIPIEADGTLARTPRRISVVEDDAGREKLATVDVGPPIETRPGARLIVMTFYKPSAEAGGRIVFTKVAAYAVGADPAGDLPVAEQRFPDSTNEISAVAFRPDGRSFLLSSLTYPSDRGPPRGELVEYSPDGAGSLKAQAVPVAPPSADDAQRGGGVVTAVAAYASTGGASRWITGRLDGSVHCGDTVVPGRDPSPVVLLRSAGPGPSFVALHQSRRLVVGRCGAAGVQAGDSIMLNDPLVAPQSLMLREIASGAGGQSASGPGLRLSFIDERRLCRIAWPAAGLPSPNALRDCWLPGLAVDQAVPAAASSGPRADEFLVLPTRSRAWVARLEGNALSRGAQMRDAPGLPVAWPPDPGRGGDVASLVRAPAAAQSASASGGGPARIRINRNERVVERQVEPGRWQPVPAVPKAPIAATINDRGDLLVLGADKDLAVVPADGRKAVTLPLPIAGSCLRLAPDGKSALVASHSRELALLNLGDGQQPVVGPRKPLNSLGAVLTACSVANNGATVTGFADGSVVYRSAEGAEEKLSTLVQFRLPSGIQDVSIDADGRFVTALGRRGDRVCVAGALGFPVRIWDLRAKERKRPVASFCLPEEGVVAIGALTQVDGRWSLPVFQEFGEQARVSDYKCMVCGVGTTTPAPANADVVIERAEAYKPRLLSPADIKNSYGIEP